MDELLLRRARKGDAEAFEQLMTPLEGLIWRVCWHYTGNREEASDCGQDTMLRIWRGLDSYRGDCAFESWVYRIAANCCMDSLRRKKRDQSVSIEPLREQGFDPADPSPGTDEKAERADALRQMREEIALLPEEQREALMMTQLDGLSYEEAAQRLGVEEGTVKSRVNRAKQKLRSRLEDSGGSRGPGEKTIRKERRPQG